MKFKSIIFDLDGTLTDSGEGIRNGVKYALNCFGIAENEEANLNRFIGPPIYEGFIKFYNIDKEEARKGETNFREYYKDKGIYENALYDGIVDCLKTLKEGGLSLYIATSKPDFMAETVTTHFDIKKYFTYISGADVKNGLISKTEVLKMLFDNNPDISPETAVMVGDREYDIFGAKNVGISSIGVLWGYGSQEEFENAHADMTVQTPKQLSEFLLSD